jgi:hypothetical protein
VAGQVLGNVTPPQFAVPIDMTCNIGTVCVHSE